MSRNPKKHESGGSPEGLSAVLDVTVVRALAEIVERHGLTEINISTPTIDLVLRRGAAGLPAETMVAVPAPVMAAPAALSAVPLAATIAAPAAVSASPSAGVSVPAPAAPEAGANGQTTTVSSPFVGTFYRSPNPNSPAFIEVGQRVKKGDVLCIVEAMKLMNEIESEHDGTIVACLVENAQPVEYGQALFKISLT
jgi:acetyl-CoA carboxylase biotin carboxyl carrier protein